MNWKASVRGWTAICWLFSGLFCAAWIGILFYVDLTITDIFGRGSPLQKSAWFGLVVGAVGFLVAVTLFSSKNIERNYRWMTVLLSLVIAVLSILLMLNALPLWLITLWCSWQFYREALNQDVRP